MSIPESCFDSDAIRWIDNLSQLFNDEVRKVAYKKAAEAKEDAQVTLAMMQSAARTVCDKAR